MKKQIELNSNQNNPHVPYQTKWHHPKINLPVIIPPYTNLISLIEQLEDALNKDKGVNEKIYYSKQQSIELRLFYQNAKKADKITPRRKTCYGWIIEYLKDENYVHIIERIKTNQLTNIVAKHSAISKPVWYHDDYPNIPAVETGLDQTPSTTAFLLNETFHYQKYEKLNNLFFKDCEHFVKHSFNKVKNAKDEKEKYLIFKDFVEEMQKKIDLFKKFSNTKPVTGTGVSHVLQDLNSTTGGWTLKKDQVNNV